MYSVHVFMKHNFTHTFTPSPFSLFLFTPVHLYSLSSPPPSPLPSTLSSPSSSPPVELEPGDKATECHCLSVPRPSPSSSLSSPPSLAEGQLSLGTYTIRWKRSTSTHPHSLISTVSFPPIVAKPRPFSVASG